jgi:hypothetical protein
MSPRPVHRRPRAWLATLTACCALAIALSAAPARAGLKDVNGHVSFGYAKLFTTDTLATPGGSLSVTGGLDHPLWRGDLRLGAEIGFNLLGSKTVTEGSLFANVDYSMFEAVLFLHYLPHGLGPIGRISAGPALLSARAELSTAGGGASFSGYATEEVAGGLAFDVTLIQQRPAPVRVGLELGTRVAFLPEDTWTLATARLAFHY